MGFSEVIIICSTLLSLNEINYTTGFIQSRTKWMLRLLENPVELLLNKKLTMILTFVAGNMDCKNFHSYFITS